ncbi:MAG: hypothetical protein K8U57_05730 [Planctomycetes bacterium]|nr:hypothetical protein [Planctomycetota bacterium]
MLPKFATDPIAQERFLREVLASVGVMHDNVVTISPVGEDRGIPDIAMEELAGAPSTSSSPERVGFWCSY